MPRLPGLALSALLALGAAPALPAQTPTHLGVPQRQLFHLRFYRAPSDPVGGNQYSGLAIFDSAGTAVGIPPGMSLVITDIRLTHQGIPYPNAIYEIAEINTNTNVINQGKWQLYLPQANGAGFHQAPMTAGLAFTHPMRPVLSTNMDQGSTVNTVYAYGYFVGSK
jgi:hypothetical protein